MSGRSRLVLTVRVTSLSRDETSVLKCLATGRASTSVVAGDCGLEPVRAVRQLLLRLERAGLTAGKAGVDGGRIRWWQITDAGRQAIGGAA